MVFKVLAGVCLGAGAMHLVHRELENRRRAEERGLNIFQKLREEREHKIEGLERGIEMVRYNHECPEMLRLFQEALQMFNPACQERVPEHTPLNQEDLDPSTLLFDNARCLKKVLVAADLLERHVHPGDEQDPEKAMVLAKIRDKLGEIHDQMNRFEESFSGNGLSQ